MHTDPDVVNEELNTLANVYVNVANYFYQGADPEDDVILLGDLNADPKRFKCWDRFRIFYTNHRRHSDQLYAHQDQR